MQKDIVINISIRIDAGLVSWIKAQLRKIMPPSLQKIKRQGSAKKHRNKRVGLFSENEETCNSGGGGGYKQQFGAWDFKKQRVEFVSDLNYCENCGTAFTGLRAGAKFCSQKCRYEHANRKKRA